VKSKVKCNFLYTLRENKSTLITTLNKISRLDNMAISG